MICPQIQPDNCIFPGLSLDTTYTYNLPTPSTITHFHPFSHVFFHIFAARFLPTMSVCLYVCMGCSDCYCVVAPEL